MDTGPVLAASATWLELLDASADARSASDRVAAADRTASYRPASSCNGADPDSSARADGACHCTCRRSR